MPAVPFIAIALGASGALAAGGAAIATAIGLGTVSTVAATAIGAGAFSAAATAVQGGSASDVLKSAVIGGVTSYAGSAIAGSVANSVSSAASGFDPGIASAMGKVAGSAVAGAVSSGTSALLSGRDPIDALLKGGLTAAMSAGIGAGVDALLKDVPAFSNPLNNQEAAIQRATKAAIGTAIASGGNADAIGMSVLNSFAATAGQYVGTQIRDSSANLSAANAQFRASESEYRSNLEQQDRLAADYNRQLAPLQESAARVNNTISEYDKVAANYNNYDSWMRSQGYEYQPPYSDEWGSGGDFWAKQEGGYLQVAPSELSKTALYNQAKALDAKAVAESNAFNDLKVQLLGGEVTRYRTEMQYQAYGDYDVQLVEVQVPYKETVTGSLTPIKNQLDSLKTAIEPLGQNLAEQKTKLENAVTEFSNTETQNAAVVKSQLDNFVTARNQYRDEFGVDPTEDQLRSFASSGDILGTVSRLVADNNNEQAAQQAGFSNYADYTAAGNISPNDYYAKQQGWQDYAEQLNAQANGYNAPSAWNTFVNNNQTAVNNGFVNFDDYQAAAGAPSNDFYAKKDGWESYAQKQEAEDSGFRNPASWNTHVVDVRNQESARAAGFPDYDTQQKFGNNLDEYKVVQEGWQDSLEKETAAQYEITSPQKYQEFVSGKTEEDKVVQMLQDRGIPATPERVADIMKSWDFNPTTPNVGFSDAFNQSDNLNISNSRADSAQEAAALAKSLGYSKFNFGGAEYEVNTAAPTQNKYDLFAKFGEAYRAARNDLGAGKNFEWTNPKTGETQTFSTNTKEEQAVADQKRIDLMPAYSGSENTRTGNPGIVDNIFYDKNSGNVVQDNRVWDQNGKLVSGEVTNINPNESGSTAEKVAASLKESFGKTFDAFKYVTSGVNKGGWELLNQVGVLGGLTGLVDMDNWATRTAADMKKVIDGYQNKEFLNNRALMNSAIAKAGNEGIFAQAVEAGKQFGLNPLQTAEFIAQQGASLFLGGGAMATARALSAGLTVQQAASIGTMAAAQGASVADQAYRDGLKNNKTPEEALNAARVAWAGAALTSAVSNKFIPGALSNEAAIASQNIAKASLSSALRGEMSAELAENTSGQIIANIAAGNDWDKDLGSTVVQSIIGSGVVTGLVQVATTGNPETAIEIAKDAGVTDKQINDIKSAFKNSVGNENYNPATAKQQLDAVLSSSNLNPEVVDQIGSLIGTEAIKEAIEPTLGKAGVPEAYVDMLAGMTARELYSNRDLPSAFGNLSTAFQAYGFDPLQANLITNQTLTGTDVKQVVTDQFKAAGYTPSQAEIDNLVSQNATALPNNIASSVSDYSAPLVVTKDEAKASLVAAGVANPSQSQIDSLAGQYDQNLLESKAIASASGLSNLISDLERQSAQGITGVQNQLGIVESALSQKIAANEASGMARDQAIEKAVTEVAQSVGQSKSDLLALIGQTQENLTQQYASGQLQLEGKLSTLDAASQQRYQSLSADQKLQAAQMAQQGKDLNQAISDVSLASQQQITGVENKLSAAIEAAKQSGLQGDAALQSAITKVAGDLGTTKDALLSQMGATETSLRQDFAGQIGGVQAQIGNVQTALQSAIADARASGLQGDQALQSAISKVAGDLGTTKDGLLAQIGATETSLRQDFATQIGGVQTQIGDVKSSLQQAIKDAQAAGLQGDQALQSAIDSVAGNLGTTKDALLAQIGTTESGLRQEFSSQIGGVRTDVAALQAQLTDQGKSLLAQLTQQGMDYGTALQQAVAAQQQQVTNVQKSLTDAMAANEAAGLTRDQATAKAIEDVAANLGTTKDSLLSQLGTTESQLRSEMQAGQALTTAQIAGLESQLTEQGRSLVSQLQQQGVSYQKALSDAIAAQNAQMTAGQQQNAQQIAGVKESLTAQITANEAAGLSRDEATTKAINDMSAQMGVDKASLLTQLGTTEQALRGELQSGLAGVTKTFQDQYNALSAAQKAQFDAMVQQGANTQAALSQVQSGLQQQITSGQQQTAEQIASLNENLSTRIAANEAAGLTRDQAINKAVQDVAASVGTTKEALLAQMGQTEAGLQQQFAAGQAQTQAQIAQLDAATQAKFSQMSEAQKAQALQLAQTTKDLQGSINTVAEQTAQQIAAGQQQTAQQIQATKDSLTAQIAANEAAGLTRDQATTKAIGDLSTQMGVDRNTFLSQLGTTEQGLRQELTSGLAGLSQSVQAQYSALNAAQKAQFDAMVQQGADINAAMAQVQAGLQQQIGELGQTQAQQYNQLSQGQKDLYGQLVAQGATQSDALNAAVANLSQSQAQQYSQLTQGQKDLFDQMIAQGANQTDALNSAISGVQGQISGVQQSLQQQLAEQGALVQQQYAGLSAAQQQEVAARIAQGASLQNAIAESQAAASQQISGVQQALQAQLAQQNAQTQQAFAGMSAAQQAEVAARIQQGQDLQTAISGVQATLGQQITGGLSNLSQEFQSKLAASDAATQATFSQMSAAQQAEAQARVQQGQDLQAAIAASQQATQQQITGGLSALSQEFQAKLAASDAATQGAFAQMNAAQQAEASARVQQGQDLQSAISAASQATQQQITGGLAALSQEFQGKLAASDAATQSAFAQMTTAQQAEAQARVQQGQDLQSAISASSQLAAQQLAQAQSALEGQLSAQGKQFFDSLRQQGLDYNAALQQAIAAQNEQIAAGQKDLSGQIGALGQATQQQYASLTAAQQKEVSDRVAQGESLQNAIASAQQATQQQINAAQQQALNQYNALTAAQKAEADARVAQGQSLQSAISDVQTNLTQQGQQTQQQISALSQQTQSQYNAMTAAQQAEVAARVAQGQSFDAAITGVGGQISALQAQMDAQKAADEAYKQEQAEKAAAASAKAAQDARMSSQSGVLASLAGLGAAAATGEETRKPLQPRYLTSKGGDTQFKGLLDEFQQEVEGAPNMPDNTGNRQESSDMSPYYSYGNETSLDQILGQGESQDFFPKFASGGLATPLMSGGGTTGARYGKYAAGGMPSPLMAAGGKMRVDFRRGDAVTGPGDGQSDDIPAMLADGEFVFPADVVAAIGNGSTKAGSDALYDMMHSIRSHVRSAKPKDLPPEIKSPLDFLKTSKTSKKRSA